MKKFFAAVLILASIFKAEAQDKVKTGLNFGPLPAVAFDADKGFQYGAILNVFNFGDGHNYPNYDSKWYFEASFFTKGSQLYQVMYDNKVLIPGIRWSSAASVAVDHAMDFYGFNGYQSFYDAEKIASGKAGDSFIYTPMYRFDRVNALVKSDFTGNLAENLKWEAGIHLNWFRTSAIDRANINKGKEDSQKYPDAIPTLFEQYIDWGLISENEAKGGFTNSIRLGLSYDTRDKEGAPTKGVWAEGHLIAAPSWLGSTNGYYRYSATMRQYFPILDKDRLTFAYRLNYEGTIGKWAPYYVLPYITVMGENGDKDGMGGYRTLRGIIRDRVVGLDMATYTAELRWRFVSFQLLNQNIAFGLSAFSDGSMVTRGRDMSYQGDVADVAARASYEAYMTQAPSEKDRLHITVGSGLRFIMNQNFIVAFEYGTPITHFMKNSPLYNQDGTGAFYINLGYLF